MFKIFHPDKMTEGGSLGDHKSPLYSFYKRNTSGITFGYLRLSSPESQEYS